MGLVAVEIMLHLILGTPGVTVDTVLDKILLELLHSWQLQFVSFQIDFK